MERKWSENGMMRLLVTQSDVCEDTEQGDPFKQSFLSLPWDRTSTKAVHEQSYFCLSGFLWNYLNYKVQAELAHSLNCSIVGFMRYFILY